jgi:hypothetical protein
LFHNRILSVLASIAVAVVVGVGAEVEDDAVAVGTEVGLAQPARPAREMIETTLRAAMV